MSLCLLDTNILLRLVHPFESQPTLIAEAVTSLRSNGETLCYTSQNMSEFWNACTRPAKNNGYGLTVEQTERYARILENSFSILADSLSTYHIWRDLIVRYKVAGAQVHDARLAAVMIAYSVPRLLTLNTRDFQRYREITTVHPADLQVS